MKPPARGTVYGTLMNFSGELAALGTKMNEAPYQAPPQAPVLYVKPANTFSENGAVIRLPSGVTEVEVGATVAMVMKSATEVAGYLLLNDLSVPHESFFRPPVKAKCIDGFLGIGDRIRARNEAGDPAVFKLEVRINGELKQTVHFSQLVRPADRLLADVSEFMTLGPGDMLMLGCDVGRPRARAGDRIDITMPALGTLSNTLVAEAA
ncbi:MAG: putative 2-keto-4-pentenoate hydratase/2-oxohepta-3-ene,7-dioic acid hydratase [Ramlibacter sp.]|jgi:5-oxopent-3-ene-1,2,5-tricarboxylate decarboxylase/2-hydroxyhepta-2,4-diene-1,7-dioate isomerase|uniref:fumarylacetoacetate hydrolase family protein n=1 Tax=Ramlibacter sp. TaxID=1917967 RepID=UPI00261497D6|nr:fumarylacetoacetate hydrolase family protein [Ramlibacter sp.]MDB5751805.1 putative 2-keto-4-pentenoate hydratase/2-oxohepta-3-ene,7-dioic acid hydratase [Ramlibacter sp.]